MNSIELRLRQVISEIARQDASQIPAETNLIEALGIDSLAGLRLLAAVEKRFAVRIPDSRLHDFRTIHQLVDFIASSSERKVP